MTFLLFRKFHSSQIPIVMGFISVLFPTVFSTHFTFRHVIIEFEENGRKECSFFFYQSLLTFDTPKNNKQTAFFNQTIFVQFLYYPKTIYLKPTNLLTEFFRRKENILEIYFRRRMIYFQFFDENFLLLSYFSWVFSYIVVTLLV